MVFMMTRRQIEKAIERVNARYAAAVKKEIGLVDRCENHPRTMAAALRAAEKTNEIIRERNYLYELRDALGPDRRDPYEC